MNQMKIDNEMANQMGMNNMMNNQMGINMMSNQMGLNMMSNQIGMNMMNNQMGMNNMMDNQMVMNNLIMMSNMINNYMKMMGNPIQIQKSNTINTPNVIDNQKVKKEKIESITFEVEKELKPTEDLYKTQNVKEIFKNLFKNSENDIPKEILYYKLDTKEEEIYNFGKKSLIQGLVTAYKNHFPITITPDMIWLISKVFLDLWTNIQN